MNPIGLIDREAFTTSKHRLSTEKHFGDDWSYLYDPPIALYKNMLAFAPGDMQTVDPVGSKKTIKI